MCGVSSIPGTRLIARRNNAAVLGPVMPSQRLIEFVFLNSCFVAERTVLVLLRMDHMVICCSLSAFAGLLVRTILRWCNFGVAMFFFMLRKMADGAVRGVFHELMVMSCLFQFIVRLFGMASDIRSGLMRGIVGGRKYLVILHLGQYVIC